MQIEFVTLHVGLGTFESPKNEDLSKHKMHSEVVEVDKKTINNILKAKKERRRIIAVGTTSVRVLETIVKDNLKKNLKDVKSVKKEVNIFIHPGYKFRIVDALITNFHLPKSTLIMLVACFLEHLGAKNGTMLIKKIYIIAEKEGYRFFSYGDAMFLKK